MAASGHVWAWRLTTALAAVLLILSIGHGHSSEGKGAAQQISLRAPLTTIYALPQWPSQEVSRLTVTVDIPANAPSDLGLGLWVNDFDGTWHQRLHHGVLSPGSHTLSFAIDGQGWLEGVEHGGQWNGQSATEVVRGGLLWWSQSTSQATVTVRDVQFESKQEGIPAASEGRWLGDLHFDVLKDGQWLGHSGQRSELHFTPFPFPSDPFDPGSFAAEMVLTHTSGVQQRVPAFYLLPKALHNRGDREIATAKAGGRFVARFRPRLPGSYTVELLAWWDTPALRHFPVAEHAPDLRVSLPSLQVSGEAWDDFVRVDGDDPRFFSINGAAYWPIGINIRSVNDSRGAERTNSTMTPDLGSISYRAFLERFAAAGGNAVEIWMSSWNLALEWRGDWPEYRGLGRYSQARAQRLEQILDDAYALGIRVNLVVRNHGQASERVDREWHNSPYNSDNGGVVARARDFFRDPQAIDYQYRYHRYLVGRYADHPAIMGWKLFSEVNLTAGLQPDVRRWHELIAEQFIALDGYGHPVTSHWSGDYRQPDRVIVAQPTLHYVCIDAYHGRRDGQGVTIRSLLWDSTRSPAPGRGLAQFGKPVLVTEYGGNWNAAPIPQLLAEHQAGAWAAMVAGHAGSPMLWWFEWVDQNDLWGPYRAISRFLEGEDLRGADARSVTLASSHSLSWAGAWARPGHLLGYISDERWALDGGRGEEITSAITIGSQISAGDIRLQWWDADRGEIILEQQIAHSGGPLVITTPPFRRHLAFKLRRD